jgi:imidazolonepropionase-like amidohydrolase
MKTAYVNVNILDGTKDMQVQQGMTIVVENGRIVSVGKDLVISSGRTVDLKNKYLLPGLINLHVHLPGSGIPKTRSGQNNRAIVRMMKNPFTRAVIARICEKYAKTELLSGVTTIRTVGGLGHIDSDIRNKINRGLLTGPRMLVSDHAISVPHGHMAGVLAYEAESKEDCIRYVRQIAEHKPDLIKLMITGGVLDATVKGEPGVLRMKPALVKAACTEAHKLGLTVAAHTESPEGVKVALENGVDSIEHGAKMNDDLIRLYKEHHAVNICTISPAVPLAKLPVQVTKSSDMTQYNGQVVMDGIIDAAKVCLANGIPVGLGTDTACPFVTHYDMWRELKYFVKYVNVTPAFALYTATLRNAEIAGIDGETGSIVPGKSADFVVVDGNPVDDLAVLRTPSLVVFRGKQIFHPGIKKYPYIEEQLNSIML